MYAGSREATRAADAARQEQWGAAVRCGQRWAASDDGAAGGRVVLRVLSATAQRSAQRSAGAGAIGVRRREGTGRVRTGAGAEEALKSTTAQGRQRRSTVGALELVAYMVDALRHRQQRQLPTSTSTAKRAWHGEAGAGGGRRASATVSRALALLVPTLTSQPLAPAAPLAAAYTRMLRGAGGRDEVVLWCRELTYQTQARVAALSRNKAERGCKE